MMMQTKIDLDLRVEDLPFVGKLNLRCKDAARDALDKAIGVPLPSGIGDVAQADDRKAVCLSTDEWMIYCSDADRAQISAACAAVYDSAVHSLVDVSFREIGLSISGVEAHTLLTMFIARDLSTIEVGSGKRTLFDTAQVTLLREGSHHYQLYVWRSFAPHVRHLLSVGETELRIGL